MYIVDWPRRTYINLKKADWARYAEGFDKYLAEAFETRTVEQAEKTFRKAVNNANGLSFRPAAFNTSNQPCRHQRNRSPMNETENAD